jgi:hypothetical protein
LPSVEALEARDLLDGTGILAQYFNDPNLGHLALTRVDATVAFSWNGSRPAAAVGPHNFSVRWSGQVQPLYSEVYTFLTISDDGVRLWVNGQLLINNWTDHKPTRNSGTIALLAGQLYDLELEYYENNRGKAEAWLMWSSASQPLEVIPRSQLYPPDIAGFAAVPLALLRGRPTPPAGPLAGQLAPGPAGEARQGTTIFGGLAEAGPQVRPNSVALVIATEDAVDADTAAPPPVANIGMECRPVPRDEDDQPAPPAVRNAANDMVFMPADVEPAEDCAEVPTRPRPAIELPQATTGPGPDQHEFFLTSAWLLSTVVVDALRNVIGPSGQSRLRGSIRTG